MIEDPPLLTVRARWPRPTPDQYADADDGGNPPGDGRVNRFAEEDTR